MFKIAGVVLCEILVYTVLKQYKPEFAVVSQAISVIVMLFLLTDEIEGAIAALDDMLLSSGISAEYITVLLKVLGISLITGFSSDMCKDAGETALASKVELAGKILVVTAALPVIQGFTGLISGMVKNI